MLAAASGLFCAIVGGIGGYGFWFKWGSIVFSSGIAAAYLLGVSKSSDQITEPDSPDDGSAKGSSAELEGELRRKDRGVVPRGK